MTQRGYAGEDQREALGVDYKGQGNLEPKEGYSFPKEWGRLVNYAQMIPEIGFSERNIPTVSVQTNLLVFEAEDGTIRMVAVDLNWSKFKIDDIKVLTIGRHSLPEPVTSP